MASSLLLHLHSCFSLCASESLAVKRGTRARFAINGDNNVHHSFRSTSSSDSSDSPTTSHSLHSQQSIPSRQSSRAQCLGNSEATAAAAEFLQACSNSSSYSSEDVSSHANGCIPAEIPLPEGVTGRQTPPHNPVQVTSYDKNRFSIIAATSLAFVLCNMDKVNMSVAIIPMAEQLGWSASTAGLVQSTFFCGYALSQLPGGWLAQKFSGRKVLQLGVLLWSIGTAVVPPVAMAVPALLLVRFMIGLGEGVAPPAATDLIAQTVPPEERSRSVAVVFGGLNVGSVAGLILAPLCIEHFGWESVFYVFGIAGIIWWATVQNQPTTDPTTTSTATSPGADSQLPPSAPKAAMAVDPHAVSLPALTKKIPWRSFFFSPAVLALIWAHFCNDWGKYALQSWLPSYYKSELNLSLTNASQTAILAPLASVAFSSVAALVADHLIQEKMDITVVRRVMQCISFLAPALCMAAVTTLDVSFHPKTVVALLTAGLGLSSFSLAGLLALLLSAMAACSLCPLSAAGLYCTHQDISPKYAGILLGITNTAGAIPGFLGTALTGFLYDATKSWNVALFAPSIFFYITGAIVWVIFASSKPQNFDQKL